MIVGYCPIGSSRDASWYVGFKRYALFKAGVIFLNVVADSWYFVMFCSPGIVFMEGWGKKTQKRHF